MGSAGSIIIGVRVIDESRADMTRYIPAVEGERLRRELREARAEAAHWEDRYWELLSQHGGTM